MSAREDGSVSIGAGGRPLRQCRCCSWAWGGWGFAPRLLPSSHWPGSWVLFSGASQGQGRKEVEEVEEVEGGEEGQQGQQGQQQRHRCHRSKEHSK